MKRAALATLAFLAAAARAYAVIVGGVDDLAPHNADPGSGAPWANVGQVNGASGIFLGTFSGDAWVLTAAHVGAGTFTLGASSYDLVAGSAVRLTNPDNSLADLTLFRIAADPGLGALTLASATPASGSFTLMVGFGRNQSGPTAWYVDTTPATWVWNTGPFAGADAIASGYAWTSGNAKRWGTNTIDGALTADYGWGTTSLLVTDFDLAAGEAQGSVGDSGGAMFRFNGSSWELAGVMTAIEPFSGQPAAVVFGNTTYGADISAYRSTILATIPEPAASSLAACVLALAGVVAFKRRRRSAA